jgi:cytochrome c oxidase subunit IV
MTTTHVEHKETPAEPHHRVHEEKHPPDRSYVILAIVLAVITAAEVWTYFWDESMKIGPFEGTSLLVVTLFPMMIAKFIIVVGWFMHLRFDNPMYRRVFVFGTILAVAVYMVFLTVMQFFSDRWTDDPTPVGLRDTVEESAG